MHKPTSQLDSQREILEIQRNFLSNLVPPGQFDCCVGGLVAGHIDTAALLSLYTDQSAESDSAPPECYVAYRKAPDGPVIGGAFIPDPKSGPGRWRFVSEQREWPAGMAVKCPVEILALLSPTDDQQALTWRALAEKSAQSVFGAHGEIEKPADN